MQKLEEYTKESKEEVWFQQPVTGLSTEIT